MATAEEYAGWIVANSDKRGTPEFETVAQAYKLARGTKPAAEPEAKPEEPSMLSQVGRQLGLTARAGLKGVTAIPAMVGDAMGMQSSGAVDALANRIGLPQPATPTERVAGDVAGAMAGAGGTARLGQSMMASAGPVVANVGNMLQQGLGSQVLAAGGAGGGASVARESGAGAGGQLAAGLAGAMAPGVLQSGAARVISPNVRPQVRTLMDEGVTPTFGQLMGGRAQVVEDKLTSVPILGDAITNAKTAGLDQFNRAIYQRALAPIGGDASAFPVGREGVKRVRDALGQAYDDVLGRVTPVIDQRFTNDIAGISNRALLTKDRREIFDRIIDDQISGKLNARLVPGNTIKEIESELGRLAGQYGSDRSVDAQHLGKAINELRGALRNMLARSNPAEAKELQAINEGYAQYAILRNAAARVGSREGVVTPSALHGGIRANDRSVQHGKFAQGDALMEDLSDAGMHVMGSKYPDSGTAGRLTLAGLTGLGTAQVSSGIPMAIGAASVPYLPGVRQGVAALMARRPAGAQTLADLLRPETSALQRGILSIPYTQ